MQRVELEVKPRNLGDNKKRNLNQLRAEGWVPGTLYGNGKPEEIAVDSRIFSKAIHTKAGMNALFNVKFGSETSLAVVKEVQRHILKHNPIHVDFKRMDGFNEFIVLAAHQRTSMRCRFRSNGHEAIYLRLVVAFPLYCPEYIV